MARLCCLSLLLLAVLVAPVRSSSQCYFNFEFSSKSLTVSGSGSWSISSPYDSTSTYPAAWPPTLYGIPVYQKAWPIIPPSLYSPSPLGTISVNGGKPTNLYYDPTSRCSPQKVFDIECNLAAGYPFALDEVGVGFIYQSGSLGNLPIYTKVEIKARQQPTISTSAPNSKCAPPAHPPHSFVPKPQTAVYYPYEDVNNGYSVELLLESLIPVGSAYGSFSLSCPDFTPPGCVTKGTKTKPAMSYDHTRPACYYGPTTKVETALLTTDLSPAPAMCSALHYCIVGCTEWVCITGETQLRLANSSTGQSHVAASQLQVGDFILADSVEQGSSQAARVEYISKSVTERPITIYGINGQTPFFTAQHELLTADGGCAMVDAAGWLARTSDYDCTPIELTVGTTLLLEADDGSAALVPVVVHSITEAVLPAGSVLYNPYLSSGWSMRGNGVLLSEPSRQHNRQWYTNPARHAAQLSVTERASIYAQSVSSSSTEGSSNAPLYAVQDQLWQSHAVAVELKISSQPVQMRSATAAGLLQQLEAIVDSWVQNGRPTATAESSTSMLSELSAFTRFVSSGELYENGQPKVWRDGVQYPTMYDIIFKLVGYARPSLRDVRAAQVQSLIQQLQVALDDWCAPTSGSA